MAVLIESDPSADKEWVRFYDSDTDDTLLVDQHYTVTEGGTIQSYPYDLTALGSNPQGISLSALTQSNNAINAMPSGVATNGMRVRSVNFFTFSFTGNRVDCRVVWFGADYDSDTLKIGTNGSNRWAEFYIDGELVRRIEAGYLAGGGSVTTVISVGHPDGDYFANGNGESTSNRYFATCSSRAAASFSLTRRLYNTNASGLGFYYFTEWIKLAT